MTKKVDIIGLGRMGKVWANSFEKAGAKISTVIDPDDSVSSEADQYGADYYTSIDDMNRGEFGDIWCITTPSENHHTYLNQSTCLDLDSVFVEKPSSVDPDISSLISDLSTSNYSVDYIELRHPVLMKILDEISRSNFRMTQSIHWRGKMSSDIHPYMRNDLVHDVSEIYALYQIQNNSISELDIRSVESHAWSQTDRYQSDPRRNIYDCKSTVQIRGCNDEPIYLNGGFNQSSERRYFLWVDDRIETAYFGSTVNRDHISPVAIRIKKSKNIAKAVQRCMDGSITSDQDIENLVSDVQGTILETKDSFYRTDQIARDVVSGKHSPCSLEAAIEIEEIVKDAYRESKVPLYRREREYIESLD